MLFKENLLIYFNWRTITSQQHGGHAIHRHESAIVTHVSPILNFPLPFPPHPSGLSQSTDFEDPASCIQLALVICFTYGSIHVSVLFSRIIPPLPSLLLPCILGCCYCLSKFYIYVLIYCIEVSLFLLTSSV